MRILLIVYDNASYISQFPIGIAQLTAIFEQHGHDVVIYNQDIEHTPDSQITTFLDRQHFDMVGLSFIGGYYQHAKALSISAAIQQARKPPFYVIGGHGPSPEPAYFMKKTGADAVCIGEGEETVIDLLDALQKGRSLSTVPGIAWVDNGVVTVNARRELIQDIDALPFPAYHRFPMHVYRLLRMPHCTASDFVVPILSGRGCTFSCNFCYRMDKGFRPRSNEAIIEEILLLKKNYGITYVAFFDELLVSSVERATLLCEDLLRRDVTIKWDCNGRLNYAKPALLRLMKKAGCTFINYGIEAFDDRILRNMNKNLTTRQITAGIEATLREGISPGLNIIFGNHGENRETLQKGVEFLLKYDDGAQLRTIRPVTPYPGSQLYYDAINMGKLKDCEDFYTNKHTNSDLMAINFTELSDNEYYAALYEANAVLLKNYQQRWGKNTGAVLEKLYVQRDSSFRGFRQT